jgi:hypothetical protein
MRWQEPGSAQAECVLDGLSRTRVRAVVTRLAHDDRSIPPPLEPMLPALAETVLFWSGGQRQVLVIHDEQSALTADRLRRLQHLLTGGADSSAAPPARVSPLAGLVTVDGRDEPRVQVADLLAGAARRSPCPTHPGQLHACAVDRRSNRHCRRPSLVLPDRAVIVANICDGKPSARHELPITGNVGALA